LILDHILLGAPNLDVASDAFANLSGITPDGGGPHPGFGTRNQLLSLDEGLFFEIIAPDPAQAENGHRAESLLKLDVPKMLTFCTRSGDLSDIADRAQKAGLAPRDPVAMSRTRQDGVTLAWEILYLDSPEWGDAIPFVIDWKGSPHPATTSPMGCTLIDFTVLHPKSVELANMYKKLGIDVSVQASLSAGFILRLETPNGEIVLT